MKTDHTRVKTDSRILLLPFKKPVLITDAEMTSIDTTIKLLVKNDEHALSSMIIDDVIADDNVEHGVLIAIKHCEDNECIEEYEKHWVLNILNNFPFLMYADN